MVASNLFHYVQIWNYDSCIGMWPNGYCLKEMNLASHVQFLDEAVYISLYANALEKGTNLSSAVGK